MKEATEKLNQLVRKADQYFQAVSPEALKAKPERAKWSKQEILGHLIDSAINNLQRFTEIEFGPKPFPIRRFAQRELVGANHYQQADLGEIFELRRALNRRIATVMAGQTPDTLKYEILLDNSQLKTLEFLMRDYVRHLEHHLGQIFGEKE
jgi:uncharacterized damage-inducible protein DinB